MKDGYSNRSVEDERRDEVMRLMEQVVKYIVYPWRRWLRYRYEQGKMHHSLVLMTTLVLMLITGCGSGNGGATEATGTTATTMTPLGKALVVYYSWSRHTKEMAEAIQANTGTNIYRIEPKEPYTNDYDTLVRLAKEERSEGKRPAMAKAAPDLQGYDTVYLGFPNWWGDMPMLLYTFLDSVDLSDKKVVVFCTSGGSGFSDTVNTIKRLEPNATVVEGLHVRDNAIDSVSGAVSTWLGKSNK